MNNDLKTYCSRCGAEMNSNSRYCMKCGNLNSEHEANTSMKGFIQEPAQNQTYQIGSGNFIMNNNSGETRETLATNTGNRLLCFLVNFVLYILLLVVGFFLSTKGVFEIETIIHSFFPFIAIGLSIFFLYFYSIQLIYMKCNQKWWYALIPIYNMMILSQIVFRKKWVGLLTLIPVIGLIPLFILFYKLGKSFHYNGLLVVLLAFLFIPMMGFGVCSYKGYLFVEDNSWMNIERDYKLRRVFFSSLVFFFVLGLVAIAKTNFSSIKESFDKIDNYYYVHVSNKFLSKVKRKIELGKYECNHNTNTFYFYYPDLRDVISVPFSMIREVVGGYVRVQKIGEEYQYYISIGDGKKGFTEIREDALNVDQVIVYDTVPSVNNDKNLCQLR